MSKIMRTGSRYDRLRDAAESWAFLRWPVGLRRHAALERTFAREFPF